MAMLSFFFRIGHLAFYQSMEKMQPFRMVNSSATQHLFKPRSRRRSTGVLLSSSPSEVNIITFSWFSTYLWRLCAGGGGGGRGRPPTIHIRTGNPSLRHFYPKPSLYISTTLIHRERERERGEAVRSVANFFGGFSARRK